MSYRLIDSNALYAEVNDLPCIYADSPNGLDGGHYTMTDGGGECEVKWHGIDYNGEHDEWTCLSCGERWLQETDWPVACPWCGKAVKR